MKRLVEEKGISVREAERQLNTDAYLEEHQQWVPSGLHCQFLLQRMFLHASARGWREYDHGVCWGRWEPSVERDLEVEPFAIELIDPESTREEIAEIYHNVYQLWRSLWKMLCDGKMEKCIHQEILDSIKECLQQRQVPALLGEEPRWSPASIPRLNPQPD